MDAIFHEHIFHYTSPTSFIFPSPPIFFKSDSPSSSALSTLVPSSPTFVIPPPIEVVDSISNVHIKPHVSRPTIPTDNPLEFTPDPLTFKIIVVSSS